MGSDGAEGRVVRVERHDLVGHVVLDRPDALNAVTVALARQLEAAVEALATQVHVVVIRGAGGNFSAGGDFHEVAALQAEGSHALAELFDSFGRACSAIERVDVPVVAAVEGYALAGGFELMQACDVALVSDDAVLADNHLNFAQVPAGGGSQRLPRLVGRQRALGLILSGERISGLDAVAWGLAYRSFPAGAFESGVSEFASRLAEKDPGAIARTKRLVREGLARSLDDGLARERAVVLEHLDGAAARARIEQFVSSRGAHRD